MTREDCDTEICSRCSEEMDNTGVFDETHTEITLCPTCGWDEPPGRDWMLAEAGYEVE